MPIYDWKCKTCEKEFEAIAPMSENGAKMTCPKCKTKGAEKQMSAFSCPTTKGGGSGPAGSGGCGHNHQGGGG